ncbi:YcxB family protein [Aquisphaera insulae]|uniref:YcxB family protein n=1 Tax=Aquisphaera insulae TaxID=2712864 RepID=UPI0013EB7825|nr:YcxB family protein [Aquisphaera insulae]
MEATPHSPQDDGPSWTIAYTYDEAEFTAAYRAGKMVRDATYGSRPIGCAMGCVLHIFLFAFVEMVVLAAIGFEGPTGKKLPWFVTLLSICLAGPLAYFLWTRVYRYRAYLRSRFRRSPLMGDLIVVKVSADRLVHHSRLGDTSKVWPLVGQAVEFRDGFLIGTDADSLWLPKRKLGTEFEEVDLSEFLRGKIANYRFIDRFARLDAPTAKGKSQPRDADFGEALVDPVPARRLPTGVASGPVDGAAPRSWTLTVPYGEEEFVAHSWSAWAARTRGMAPAFVSRWIAGLILGLLTLSAIMELLIPPANPNQPIPLGFYAMLAGLWVAFLILHSVDLFYTLPRKLRRAYRAAGARICDVHYEIGPSRFVAQDQINDVDVSWDAVRFVCEFPDCFIIQVGQLSHWIPKRALPGDLPSEVLASFLRDRVPRYRVSTMRRGRPEA